MAITPIERPDIKGRHRFVRDFVTDSVTCSKCGRGAEARAMESLDAVEKLYAERCPEKKVAHEWGTAPGERGFMLPPVCTHCGKSQKDVHPHSACQVGLEQAIKEGSFGLAVEKIEGQAYDPDPEGTRIAAATAGMTVEAYKEARRSEPAAEPAISRNRLAELDNAIEMADAGGLGVAAGMVIVPTRELRALLDAYETTI